MAMADGLENEDERPGYQVHTQQTSTRALESVPIIGAYRTNLYAEKPNSRAADQTPDLEAFHAFTWICAVPNRAAVSKAGSSSEKPASDTFGAYFLDASRYRQAKSEVGDFLEARLSSKERQIYSSTVEKSMLDIAEVHKSVVRNFEGEPVGRSEGRSFKAEFAWAAKVALDFFFPVLTEDKVVQRYWGGVHAILSLPVSKHGQLAVNQH